MRARLRGRPALSAGQRYLLAHARELLLAELALRAAGREWVRGPVRPAQRILARALEVLDALLADEADAA